MSGYYKTIDPKNFINNIRSSWNLFAVDDEDISEEIPPAKMELSERDIRIYSYFPEYIKNIEYYMLGKMLENEKKMPSDDRNDDKNDGRNHDAADIKQSNDDYEKTLRTNMIFLVRYWDELKFDLDKVLLLIKISLNDPLRVQSSKQQSIREVCYMLANLIEKRKYIYSLKTIE